MPHSRKLYCYADETGQDTASSFFIVVVVVSDTDQTSLRDQIVKIESIAKIGYRKWHKSRGERRRKFLRLILEQKVCKGGVYFGYFQKPLPYFLPILETLEKAIRDAARDEYRAIVAVDGIDRKKAAELTNALRLREIKLEFVRSRRDESEPLIRLADRWAGCIRAAFLKAAEERELFTRAKLSGYLHSVLEPENKESPSRGD